MEIFQHNIDDYAIALDIIYQLEKLELVTIIHEKGTIDVALIAQGWHYAENKANRYLHECQLLDVTDAGSR